MVSCLLQHQRSYTQHGPLYAPTVCVLTVESDAWANQQPD